MNKKYCNLLDMDLVVYRMLLYWSAVRVQPCSHSDLEHELGMFERFRFLPILDQEPSLKSGLNCSTLVFVC